MRPEEGVLGWGILNIMTSTPKVSNGLARCGLLQVKDSSKYQNHLAHAYKGLETESSTQPYLILYLSLDHSFAFMPYFAYRTLVSTTNQPSQSRLITHAALADKSTQPVRLEALDSRYRHTLKNFDDGKVACG